MIRESGLKAHIGRYTQPVCDQKGMRSPTGGLTQHIHPPSEPDDPSCFYPTVQLPSHSCGRMFSRQQLTTVKNPPRKIHIKKLFAFHSNNMTYLSIY